MVDDSSDFINFIKNICYIITNTLVFLVLIILGGGVNQPLPTRLRYSADPGSARPVRTQTRSSAMATSDSPSVTQPLQTKSVSVTRRNRHQT